MLLRLYQTERGAGLGCIHDAETRVRVYARARMCGTRSFVLVCFFRVF